VTKLITIVPPQTIEQARVTFAELERDLNRELGKLLAQGVGASVNLGGLGLSSTNSGTENSDIIQRTFDSLPGPATLFTPAGSYYFDRDIIWPPGVSHRWLGEGKNQTRWFYTGAAPIAAMFRYVPGSTYEGNELIDFGLIGNGKVGSIIDCFPSGNPAVTAQASHTLVQGVGCQAHTGWALRLNKAYSSRILLNEFFNQGVPAAGSAGIACYGTQDNQNNLEVLLNMCYNLDGLAAAIGNGLGVDILGNGFEGCKKGGLYVFDMRHARIGGYFERSGSVGFQWTGGPLKKAEILLSAGIAFGSLALDGNLRSILIDGGENTGYNTGGGGAGVDALVFTNRVDSLSVKNMEMYDPTKYGNTLEVYDPTGRAVIGPCKMEMNTKSTKAFTDFVGGISVAAPVRGARWFVDERGPTAKAASIPVTDNWLAGDEVKHDPPAAGQPKSWLDTADGAAVSTVRANVTAYAVGVWAQWSVGTTVWEVIVAGNSAGAAPSIAGKVVGDTVVDGTVTWIMRNTTVANFLSTGLL
jgi:hypothetical protein